MLLICFAIVLGILIYSKKNEKQIVENLIATSRQKFGGNYILGENQIHRKLDSLLENKNFSDCLAILDTANLSNSTKLDYQGQILLGQRNFRASIDYFNRALELEGNMFHNSLTHRAKAYTELSLYDSALFDYKIIASINYDFYRQVAETFEIMK